MFFFFSDLVETTRTFALLNNSPESDTFSDYASPLWRSAQNARKVIVADEVNGRNSVLDPCNILICSAYQVMGDTNDKLIK